MLAKGTERSAAVRAASGIAGGIVLALTLAAARLDAAPTMQGPLTIGEESKIWVEGTSTIRSWKCEAGDVAGEVKGAGSGQLEGVNMLAGKVASAGLTLSVEKLECGNGTMNEHMKKALKMGDHATIAFQLLSYEMGAPGDSGIAVTMRGKLTIAGQTRDVEVAGMASEGDAGSVRVHGKYDLLMTEYGVKPPSLMLGTMKVRDAATVFFDVVVKQ